MQVHASARALRLITFDADGTLYADGAHMQHDSEMIGHIINLMRRGVHVAIVTAAGVAFSDAHGHMHTVSIFDSYFANLHAAIGVTHMPYGFYMLVENMPFIGPARHCSKSEIDCSLAGHGLASRTHACFIKAPPPSIVTVKCLWTCLPP